MQFLSKIVLKKFIKDEISSVGFDGSYINSAFKKHLFFSIKIFDLSTKQATILKQTALSCDCDCAIHKNVLDNSIENTDCILSGTYKQLENVLDNLLKQPFSLAELSEEIKRQLSIQISVPQKSKIMGILNLTPDSFSDGGEFVNIDRAINHAIDMIEQGAEVIDIGAQSTRPQADIVSVSYEIEKVVPIITALKTAFPHIELSVDTMTLGCAQAAIDAGVDIINDVSFLKNNALLNLCKDYNKKLVIMHSRGNSKTMDKLTTYDNLIDDIYKDIYNKVQEAISLGLDKNSIIIDVGFGFAKSIEQNFLLLDRISEFKSIGCPILAGVSRKRFLQDVINTKEPKDADIQTLLAVNDLIHNNIEYIRVHNVELAMQALKYNDRL